MTTLRSGTYRALRRVHILLDALVVLTAMLLASVQHDQLRAFFPSLKTQPAFHEHALLVYFVLPLWLVLVYAFGLHRSFERVWGRAELIAGLAKLHATGLVGLALIQFLTQAVINRSLVALFLLCTFALMLVERVAINAWARFQHSHAYNQERFVLAGDPSPRMREFVRSVLGGDLPPKLVGYVHDVRPNEMPGQSVVPGGLPWLGAVVELDRLLHEQPIDHVLFFPPYNQPEKVGDLCEVCERLGVAASFVVDLNHISRVAPRVATVASHPFITFDVAPERGASLAVKHGLDPILAALLLIVISPVLLLVSLSILLTMGRPIFFVQARAGLYGRRFRMLKFRSMVAGAEKRRESLQAHNEMQGPTFKMTNDPRVTWIGRILRKTSIDELPQLFNVLVGTMSLVGPRPLPLLEQDQIRGLQRRRLSMKPGITCLWQISGRSDLGFDEWMLLDIKYIDEWSLGLDFLILLKTIPVVLFGRGAR